MGEKREPNMFLQGASSLVQREKIKDYGTVFCKFVLGPANIVVVLRYIAIWAKMRNKPMTNTPIQPIPTPCSCYDQPL